MNFATIPESTYGEKQVRVQKSDEAGVPRFVFPAQPAKSKKPLVNSDYSNLTVMPYDLTTTTEINSILETPVRILMEHCSILHPMISIDRGIFGGIPHLKEMRLSVGDILAQLYMLGSVQAVVDAYAPDVTGEHIKEAIAYAQDFLEAACEPYQADG